MKLTVNNLSVSYNKKSILKGVSFAAEKGSITALIGRNGAGKSTIINCIIGEKRNFSGNILLNGKNISEFSISDLSGTVSCLPQDIPAPHVRVKELVAFGRTPYLPLNGRLSDTDKRAVEKAISSVKMEAFADSFVDTLSGGERKKAFFAMTLAQDTPLVILDEPTAHLDAAARFEFMGLIEKLRDETGKTFLIVMHELSEVLSLADKIVALKDGGVFFEGTSEEALNEKIPENCFGVKIIGSKEEGYALAPLK